ncbi:hypothetical protein FISHEDRAFT_57764 [Fistulina hepatica ATCC 64428]|uniref:Secreted protein n=1 Tax=Fistulina hepatica ATCC 64428 TaxID=1128425 RepID=A0A0D7AFF7_9AGAR|nr:hypothetical protein FISHEDRAFT_57764 [Fistulina hepatica ATCC 64428]
MRGVFMSVLSLLWSPRAIFGLDLGQHSPPTIQHVADGCSAFHFPIGNPGPPLLQLRNCAFLSGTHTGGTRWHYDEPLKIITYVVTSLEVGTNARTASLVKEQTYWRQAFYARQS